MKDSARNMK